MSRARLSWTVCLVGVFAGGCAARTPTAGITTPVAVAEVATPAEPAVAPALVADPSTEPRARLPVDLPAATLRADEASPTQGDGVTEQTGDRASVDDLLAISALQPPTPRTE